MHSLNNQQELSILVNGKKLREYSHEGNIFIEGRKNSEFSIILKNNGGTKLKAIMSVDGLSVIDGNPAGIESDGYVINPFSVLQVDGWRTSEQTVNAFIFESKKRSYNSRTNQNSKNIGVIGIMLFAEKVAPLYYMDNWRTTPIFGSGIDMMPTSICSTNDWMQTSDIGTGFGDEIQSYSVKDYTKFESTPLEVMCIYYDDKEGLERRGIVVDSSKSMPNAFPNYYTENKFAKRPIK